MAGKRAGYLSAASDQASTFQVRGYLLNLQTGMTAAVLQVDLALLPAVTGDFGVMPGHVPTVAQLRPGAHRMCSACCLHIMSLHMPSLETAAKPRHT